MDFIDLHIHTNASDGTDSPARVVEKARELGLAAIAITDHDTIAGVEEAQARGRELGVEVVSGVELAVDYYGRELHLLGYFVPKNAPGLERLLAEAAEQRAERNGRIIALLRQAGYPISLEELQQSFPGQSLGRPHICTLLVRKGVIPSVQEGFKTLVGAGKPYYVPRKRFSLGTAAAALREAGAVSSLAHPYKYGCEGMQMNALMQNVRCCGVAHLEAFYSDYDEEQTQELRDTAREWGMDVTGGSDYHGENRGVQLCVGRGGLRVPDWVLEDMKSYRAEEL